MISYLLINNFMFIGYNVITIYKYWYIFNILYSSYIITRNIYKCVKYFRFSSINEKYLYDGVGK